MSWFGLCSYRQSVQLAGISLLLLAGCWPDREIDHSPRKVADAAPPPLKGDEARPGSARDIGTDLPALLRDSQVSLTDTLPDTLGGSCVPNCVVTQCGADDGCGNPCQVGVCPQSNETCRKGKCVCEPVCAAKACGADDGCGNPCQTGHCPSPKDSCVAGQCRCKSAGCSELLCGQPDSCGIACTTGCRTVLDTSVAFDQPVVFSMLKCERIE